MRAGAISSNHRTRRAPASGKVSAADLHAAQAPARRRRGAVHHVVTTAVAVIGAVQHGLAEIAVVDGIAEGIAMAVRRIIQRRVEDWRGYPMSAMMSLVGRGNAGHTQAGKDDCA